MSVLQTFTFSMPELEETFDVVKVALLEALVRSGKLEREEADEWAKIHTIIRRPKGIFRTLSDLFSKEKAEPLRDVILIVKKI